ncbi:MAG TPA: methyltransferase domain-containing protein [Salinibacter sp.]|nr:methyltransferase domain-containing protein [Salinibacter sp.]
MAKTTPFDAHPDRYDDWFDRYEAAYRSELRAVRSLWPDVDEGVEVGVGTGRFAAHLGIEDGVDPSPEMRKRTRERGIAVQDGVAEDLPYSDGCFDGVLMTTTLCYLDDLEAAFSEAFRVLRAGGALLVGFLDRDGPLGHRYEERRDESVFYKSARFHAARDVVHLLEESGFEDLQVRQTLFSDPAAMTEPDPVREGSGDGGFVVLRGTKPN